MDIEIDNIELKKEEIKAVQRISEKLSDAYDTFSKKRSELFKEYATIVGYASSIDAEDTFSAELSDVYHGGGDVEFVNDELVRFAHRQRVCWCKQRILALEEKHGLLDGDDGNADD